MNKLSILIVVILFTSIKLFGVQTVIFQPENLDFEESSPGKMPAYWIIPEAMQKSGYNAYIVNTTPSEGELCCRFNCLKTADSALPEGIIQQRISALAFRGKKVSFSAMLKGLSLNDTSNVHFFVYIRNIGTSFLYEKLQNQPINTSSWEKREIILDIPLNATDISFGVTIHGLADAYIDDVKINILPPEQYIVDNKIQALSKQAIANIFDFANLYSQIKFFSPSSECLSGDWDGLLLNGIAEVEKITKKEKLISSLNNIFLPIAPAIKVTLNDEPYEYKTPSNSIKDSAMVMLHSGAYSPFATSHFGTQHRNVYTPQKQREGAILQIIKAESARGKTVEFSAMLKMEQADVSGYAQLWLRVDREGGYVQSKRMTDPITENKWVKQTIKVKLGDDITNLRLGLVLFGEGKAYFDNVSVKIVETGEELAVNNPDFENGGFGKPNDTWNFAPSVKSSGYESEFVIDQFYSGKQALMLKTMDEYRIHLSQPGDYCTFKSPQGYYAKFPLCLNVDSIGTLPHATKKITYDYKPMGSPIDVNDRLGRLAVLTDLYAFLKNFALYTQEYKQLDSLYKQYLSEFSSNQIKQDEFDNRLNDFIGIFKEPSNLVWEGWKSSKYSLPFRCFVGDDNKVYVSQSQDSTYVVEGCEIISVDGKKLSDIIKNKNNSFDLMQNSKRALQFRVGDKGSTVEVEYKDPKNQIKKSIMKRDVKLIDIQETRPPIVYAFDSLTVYFDLAAFTDKELARYNESLKKIDNIIFDCRGNSGVSPHYFASFLSKNLSALSWKIPYYGAPFNPANDFNRLGSTVKATNILENKNVYFLVNEKTIGLSSDVILFAMKYKLGKIVGRKFKASRPETVYYNLPGTYCLSFAPGDAFWEDGKSIFNDEIIPDILVKINSETVREQLPYINEALLDIQNQNKK